MLEAENELFGEGDRRKGRLFSCFCDPKRPFYRFMIVFILAMIYTCVFFVIELPTSLQTIIIKGMNINAKQYNLLFSAFTIPDTVISMFGGVLVDKVIGIRSGLVLFAFVSLLGEIIFAVGGFVNSYIVALIGRVVLGCGLGMFKNTVFVFMVLWYKGNLITSIAACGTRVGTAMGIVLPQIVYSHLGFIKSQNYRIGITFSLGVVALAIATILSVITVTLDKRGARTTGGKAVEKRKFRIRDFKDFSSAFWLTTLPLAMYFGVLYSFTANGQFFLMAKFGYDKSTANLANLLIFTAPIIITPLVGISLECVGYNVVWALFGIILSLSAQMMYCFSGSLMSYMPFIAAIVYSIAASIVANALYPIPAFLVQRHQLTTAYSLYNVQYCLAFSFISLIMGFLIDNQGFLFQQIYLINLLFIIFILIVTVIALDLFRYQRLLLVPGRLSEILKERKYRNYKPLRENDFSDEFSYVNWM